MKIAIKILENVVNEEALDPEQSFDAPISAEQLRQEPLAAYMMQRLNKHFEEFVMKDELESLKDRVMDLEAKMGSGMADSTKLPPSLKENKENPMKITKKILENIIREELASILQEQDPIKAKEKILADLKAKIKAEKDPKKKKKLEKELEDKEVELAGPAENADQDPRSK